MISELRKLCAVCVCGELILLVDLLISEHVRLGSPTYLTKHSIILLSILVL